MGGNRRKTWFPRTWFSKMTTINSKTEMLVFPAARSSIKNEAVGSSKPANFRTRSNSSRLRSVSEVFEVGMLENHQQYARVRELTVREDKCVIEALAKFEEGDADPIGALVKEGRLNRAPSGEWLGEEADIGFEELNLSSGNTISISPMNENETLFEIVRQEAETAGESPQLIASHPRTLSISRAKLGLRSGSLSSVSIMHPYGRTISMDGMDLEALGFSVQGTSPEFMELHGFEDSMVGPWTSNSVVYLSQTDPDEDDSDELESETQQDESELSPRTVSRTPRTASARNSGPKSSRRTPKANTYHSEDCSSPEAFTKSASAPIAIPRSKSAGGRMTSASSNKRSAPPLSASQTSQLSILSSEEIAASRRAQGVPMVGAYSPDSRRRRVEKFVTKRDRRVWKKKVKYDVRKNFADSRLRVKGRFVRKEDEEMLKEFMAMI